MIQYFQKDSRIRNIFTDSSLNTTKVGDNLYRNAQGNYYKEIMAAPELIVVSKADPQLQAERDTNWISDGLDQPLIPSDSEYRSANYNMAGFYNPLTDRIKGIAQDLTGTGPTSLPGDISSNDYESIGEINYDPINNRWYRTTVQTGEAPIVDKTGFNIFKKIKDIRSAVKTAKNYKNAIEDLKAIHRKLGRELSTDEIDNLLDIKDKYLKYVDDSEEAATKAQYQKIINDVTTRLGNNNKIINKSNEAYFARRYYMPYKELYKAISGYGNVTAKVLKYALGTLGVLGGTAGATYGSLKLINLINQGVEEEKENGQMTPGTEYKIKTELRKNKPLQQAIKQKQDSATTQSQPETQVLPEIIFTASRTSLRKPSPKKYFNAKRKNINKTESRKTNTVSKTTPNNNQYYFQLGTKYIADSLPQSDINPQYAQEDINIDKLFTPEQLQQMSKLFE